MFSENVCGISRHRTNSHLVGKRKHVLQETRNIPFSPRNMHMLYPQPQVIEILVCGTARKD
jgi:hypothetical protein